MTDVATPFASESHHGPTPRARRSRMLRLLPLAAIAAGLVLGVTLGLHDYMTLDYLGEARAELSAAVDRQPVLAALAFTGLSLVVTAFGFPVPLVLALFGGVLFGWVAGGLLATLGVTVGATIIYVALRTAFGVQLRRWVGGFAARLTRGFERNAFMYLLALRLAPFIPFFALNLACAPFRIRLSVYAPATFLGVLPITLIFARLGEGLDDAVAAAAAAGRGLSLSDLMTPGVWLALAGLTLVAILPVIVKNRRKRR